MATPFVTGDLIRVTYWTQFAEQAGLMVLHWKVTAVGGTGTNLEDAATSIMTQHAPQIVACMNSQAKLEGVIAKRLQFGLSAESGEFYSTNIPSAGTVAGDALPRQTCGIITKRTSLSGPRRRGRIYVPFPSETHNAIGAVPDANYVTLIGALANVWENTLQLGIAPNTTSLKLQVYSRVGGTTVEVSQLQERRVWATQRRRGSYGKTNRSPF